MENGWYWVRWHSGGDSEVLCFSSPEPGTEGHWHASGVSLPLDPAGFAVVARVEPPAGRSIPLERLLHQAK